MKNRNSRALKLVSLLVLFVIAGTALIARKQIVYAERILKARANTSANPTLQDRNQQDVRELTTALVSLNKQYHSANAAERSGLLQRMMELASARQELLLRLMQNDPAEVLRVAVPNDVRAGMPPQIGIYVEQRVDLSGELEVLYQENETESQILYSLMSGKERLSLHFTTLPNKDLLTGTIVRVKGVRVADAIAFEGGADGATSTSTSTQTTQTTASISPNTFGEQKVLVLLVNFQDKATQPWTIDQVRNVMTSVNDFYKESSYQQTWITADVFGWYTLPISSSTCDQNSIASYAKQAATAAGINLSAYSRYVYAYPSLSCGWIGWGTYGGNPSQAWINGVFTLKNVGHEMGHNFGVYHARALDCGSNVIGSNCTYIEYGDTFDIMGNTGVTAHSHAAQKERLGWLNYGVSPGITTVQSSGTYWIDPYEILGTNAKALKILKSVDSTTGMKTWYYVEFRRALGFDSFLSNNSNVMNGVVVHTGTEGYSFDEYLLDLTPSTSAFSDGALDVGLSYNDPNINLTITPLSVGSTGASVSVTFGPQPCVQANPSMTLSPSTSQWVSAGSTVTYQVSVTNNDSGGCTASSFNLQDAVPSGWIGIFDKSALALSPGSSTTVNLTVTSPSTTADGFYDVAIMASDSSTPSYSASATVTCAIMSALGVSVAGDQASYTRSQTATIKAIVTANGAPVSGATVSFTMTKVNGTKVTGSATSATDGSAVFKYRFNKQKDPTGTYQVSVTANLNGVAGSGTTTFLVK